MNAADPRRTGAAALVGAAAVAVLALPPSGAAQQWTLEARGGELRYEGGPGLESSSALAGVRYAAPSASFVLSGGIPLSGEDPLWGAVAGWKRLAREEGPVTFGLDLSADAFGQRDRTSQIADDGLIGRGRGLFPRHRPIPEEPLDGWGLSGRAMGVVALGNRSVDLEVRAGGASYRSEFADQPFDRDLLEADARLSWAPSPVALLTASARHAEADEGGYDRVGVGAAFDHGRGMLWGSVGTWLEDGIDAPEWSAGASLDLTDRVALRVTASHDVFDPLYMAPERTSWGVGVSVKLNRLPRPAPPVPASYEGGRATIVLDADAVPDGLDGVAGAIRIAGDFSDWEPVAMRRSGDGWSYTRALEPGVYNYAFVTPDGEWFVPESHPGRKADGFGGHVAVLVVEEAG